MNRDYENLLPWAKWLIDKRLGLLLYLLLPVSFVVCFAIEAIRAAEETWVDTKSLALSLRRAMKGNK